MNVKIILNRLLLMIIFVVGGVVNVSGDSYKLITSVDDLEPGAKYIIASAKDNYNRIKVMVKYISGNNHKQVETTVCDDIITYSDTMACLTLGGSEGSWTFHDGDNYLTATSTTSNNYLKTVANLDKYSCFSIAFSDNEAIIKSTGKNSRNVLRYNSSDKLFACYSSDNTQKSVFLYKQVADSEIDTPTTNLMSLNISGDPVNISYYVGDIPSADGLIVTAHYDDESTKDVTDDVFWTFNPEIIDEGTTQLTATATYEGQAVTLTYDIITVVLESLTITGEPTKTSYLTGEVPSADGFTVTANYSNGTTRDVSNEVAWTFVPGILSEETTEVLATAAYANSSISTTFAVTVSNTTFVTLDLTTNTATDASSSEANWDAVVLKMNLSKGNSSANANKYKDYIKNGHTRFFKDQVVTLNPRTEIEKIVMFFTDEVNAAVVSSYENATSSRDGITRTLVPLDMLKPIKIIVGTAIWLTRMDIYYKPTSTTITSAGISTFCPSYNTVVPAGMKAFVANDEGDVIRLTEIEPGQIAAGEGVVLKAEQGTYRFVATTEVVGAHPGNMMVGVMEDTGLTAEDGAYLLTRTKGGTNIAFRRLATNYTLGANKAYLSSASNAKELKNAVWNEDGTTGIVELKKEKVNQDAIYNLSGQKIRHLKKGINIVNGRLIVR